MNTYIVLDIETTGISPDYAMITEIGAAKVVDDHIVGTFSKLINPQTQISEQITELTGITNEMVKNEGTIDLVLPDFIEFCEDLPIIGHNVIFDFSFLKTNALRCKLHFEKKALDTLDLSRKFMERQTSYSLTNLLVYWGINRENAHRGLDDALATHELYQHLKERYKNEETEMHFTPKPLLWKPIKQSPITDKQKSFLTSLIRKHHVVVDYEVEALSKSEASRKIDKLLSTYGKVQ